MTPENWREQPVIWRREGTLSFCHRHFVAVYGIRLSDWAFSALYEDNAASCGAARGERGDLDLSGWTGSPAFVGESFGAAFGATEEESDLVLGSHHCPGLAVHG